MDQSGDTAALTARLAAAEAQLSEIVGQLPGLRQAETGISEATTLRIANDNTWMLLTATVVFLMQYGFALLESGMCRKNNTTATYTKNILDATLGSLVALGMGYNIAYSESPITKVVGSTSEMMESVRVSSAFFHHLVFQATSATIVSGAMAERTTIFAYCILTCFISGIPFSFAVRWTWGGGWLDEMGFIDFAGGAVVHLVGGASAAAGVYIVGEREGRHDPRRFYEFMPHDVSSVMSGSLVLWVGWYGFNMGSVATLDSVHAAHQAANAAVTTTVAAATGAVTSVLLALSRSVAIGSKGRTVDAIALSNGLLSGLVAITAGADAVYVIDSMWIGIGSGFAYMISSAISEACYLDDVRRGVVEAGAVHAGCGIWSVIACGLFHPTKGLFYTGKWWFLFVQIFGATTIALLAFFSTLAVAYWLRWLDYLRVPLEEEEKGLDHKFGLAASAFHLQRAQRIKEASAVIRDTGGTVPELIEALQSVKHQYLLPFSPQASDKVIEGQVIDVLSRLNTVFEGKDPRTAGVNGAAANEAAANKVMANLAVAFGTGPPAVLPVKVPPLRSIPAPKQLQVKPGNSPWTANELGLKVSQGLGCGTPHRCPPPPSSASSVDKDVANGADTISTTTTASSSEASGERLSKRSSLKRSSLNSKLADETKAERKTRVRIKWLAYMSHHKQDGGDAARVFADTARRIFGLYDEDDDDITNDLIYLDKDNLSDLSKVLNHVNASGNFILMLTRQALERPSVLAELVRAHRSKKPLLVMTTIWPGDDSSPQGRSFKFPQHLDEAIDEWQEYYYEARQREKLIAVSEQEEAGFISKLVASSVFLSLLSQFIKDMVMKTTQERPANASSWEQERWTLIRQTIAIPGKKLKSHIFTPLKNKLSALMEFGSFKPRHDNFQSLEA